MAYAHGIKWSDGLVEDEIKKVMKALNVERMPSNSEMILVRGDTSLSNRVGRSGGFEHWAKKLGLDLKKSETTKGWEYEEKAQGKLESLGFKVERMSTKHAYDLLVNNAVKVDIKVSSRYYYEEDSYFHTFNLEKKYHAFDFIIGYCLDNNGNTEKTVVIPTVEVMNISQISLGVDSMYDKYEERWDLIDSCSKMFQKLKKLA